MSAVEDVAPARWRHAQALVTAARDAGQPPVLRALHERGTGLRWLSFWGMHFTQAATMELAADDEFQRAVSRGMVGQLVEVIGAPPCTPGLPVAAPWIVALESIEPLPPFLPPLVTEVRLPLQLGGEARYTFTRPIYAMAAVALAANS